MNPKLVISVFLLELPENRLYFDANQPGRTSEGSCEAFSRCPDDSEGRKSMSFVLSNQPARGTSIELILS